MIESITSIHAGYDAGTVAAKMEHGYLYVTRRVAFDEARVNVSLQFWGNPALVVDELRALLDAAEGAVGEPLPFGLLPDPAVEVVDRAHAAVLDAREMTAP